MGAAELERTNLTLQRDPVAQLRGRETAQEGVRGGSDSPVAHPVPRPGSREPGFQPLAEGCVISLFHEGCVCHRGSWPFAGVRGLEPALVARPSQGRLEGSSRSRVSWFPSAPAWRAPSEAPGQEQKDPQKLLLLS